MALRCSFMVGQYSGDRDHALADLGLAPKGNATD
jgi:hypothetical protein